MTDYVTSNKIKYTKLAQLSVNIKYKLKVTIVT
jgi:hypothetical protein